MADQPAAVVDDNVDAFHPDHPTLDLWVCLFYQHKTGAWATYSMADDETYVRQQAKWCVSRGYPTRVFHVRDA